MKREDRFSKVPWWLLDMIADGDLPGQVMLTYAALNKYVRFGKGEEGVWPSQATLAKDTGLTDRSVREHLRVMEEAGVIVRTPRSTSRGRSSDLITLTRTRPPTGSPLPVGTGSPLPGNESQLNETPPSPDPVVVEPQTQVSLSTHVSSDEPADSPPIPNSESLEQTKPLPVVLRRMLTKAGVTDAAMPTWEMAWVAAQQAEWPDWAEVERTRFYADHLPIYLSKTMEAGKARGWTGSTTTASGSRASFAPVSTKRHGWRKTQQRGRLGRTDTSPHCGPRTTRQESTHDPEAPDDPRQRRR
jgi:hypothetical protein